MYKHDHSRHFANAARVAVALCALAALGGRAAQAQVVQQLTDPSQLGAFTFTTTPFLGANMTSNTPSPLTLPAGPDTVTFSETKGNVFSTIVATATNEINFTPGMTVLQTADANNHPLGPLNLAFSTGGVPGVGVSGFGLRVQDFAFDQETFTVQVFSGLTGSNLLNTFTYGPFDNTGNDPNFTNGRSVFVGALATPGTLITKAIISSFSFDQGQETAFSNDIFVGPVTVTNVPAVPEASTVVSFGMGLMLFGGLALGAHRRKAIRATQSAA